MRLIDGEIRGNEGEIRLYEGIMREMRLTEGGMRYSLCRSDVPVI